MMQSIEKVQRWRKHRCHLRREKNILKWNWKFENVCEVQQQWRQEYGTEPPTCLSIAHLCDKFETEGTVMDMHKGRSGQSLTATSEASSVQVLDSFTCSPRKSRQQYSRETGVSRASVSRILHRRKWKAYIPQLLHALNEDNLDRRIQFCEWYLAQVEKDANFVSQVLWCGEEQFTLNGTVNRYNCVYWAPENPHVYVKKAVNSPGLSVWGRLSSRGVIGPFFFQDMVTGQAYLEMLETLILPSIRALFDDNPFLIQQDGVLPHFHLDVHAYLDNTTGTLDRTKGFD